MRPRRRAHIPAGGAQTYGGNAQMKKWFVTSLLVLGSATPAFAQEKFFVTVDTVGNCSVISEAPGTELSAGKTVIGNPEGYASMEAAKKYLDEIRNDDVKCKGIIVG
jgi:hypothetical protein